MTEEREGISDFPEGFEYRIELRNHVTPRLLKGEPIHRWFAFPHSFSPQLIDVLTKEFSLEKEARILDPFVGAGTTLLRAKQKGYSATGVDLSPLSTFVSKAKIHDYDREALTSCLQKIIPQDVEKLAIKRDYPKRLRKAFSDTELSELLKLHQQINDLEDSVRPFFILAFLNVIQKLSRAVPDGGWFRWVDKPEQGKEVYKYFRQQAGMQLADLCDLPVSGAGQYQVHQLDARNLGEITTQFDALITSPPYPNRHDYSRIFHIELLTLGLSEEDVFSLRHRLLRSHVEAHSPTIGFSGFRSPDMLSRKIASLPEDVDPRIAPMLLGYFEDLYLSLKSFHKVLKADAPCAFVVGNVRHAGIMIPVDEILIKVGNQVGFEFNKAWVARLRGNSAQQMARYGRERARETILFLRRN